MTDRITFHRAGDLTQDIRPLPYLIKGILESGVLATLIAPPATGKSFIGLDWLCCHSTGTQWQGHKVTGGVGLYIAGEGHQGVRMRLRAWELGHGVSLADAPLYVSDRAVAINSMDGFGQLVEAIDELPERPDFVVVDTLARAYAGNENSSEDMGAFVRALDELARMLGATILVVHHSGLGGDDRGRGSTALRGAVDREWIAKSNDGVIVLTCHKAKDAELPAPVGLRLESVPLGITDDDGEPVSSAVLRAATVPTGPAKGIGANQARALSALRRLYAKARNNLSKQGRDPDKALVTLALWKEESDLDRRRFAEVRRALEDRGDVIVENGLHVRLPVGGCDA